MEFRGAMLTMMVLLLSWKADNSWGGLSGADNERSEGEVATLHQALTCTELGPARLRARDIPE